jgi:P-type Cu+ transporter
MEQVERADSARTDDHDSAPSFGWIEAIRIVAVALAAVAVRLHAWEPLPHISVIGVAGVLIGGWPIFEEAFQHVAARRMTMELSMAIAIVAAAAISEYFTALIITLFVLIAEVLEGMTVSRGRRAIRDLLDFIPRTATVRRADGVVEISADKLIVGDSVLLNPGAQVPVDGVVTGGHSFVDEARITGELMATE